MSDKPYILSVDDELLNQEIVTDLLEGEFNIETVNSGQECLTSVSQKQPELILLDVNMPGISGLDTCVALRANKQTKHIPIIFVSALASATEIQQGMDVGANDYVTKPFDEYDLIKTIHQCLKMNTE